MAITLDIAGLDLKSLDNTATKRVEAAVYAAIGKELQKKPHQIYAPGDLYYIKFLELILLVTFDGRRSPNDTGHRWFSLYHFETWSYRIGDNSFYKQWVDREKWEVVYLGKFHEMFTFEDILSKAGITP